MSLFEYLKLYLLSKLNARGGARENLMLVCVNLWRHIVFKAKKE